MSVLEGDHHAIWPAKSEAEHNNTMASEGASLTSLGTAMGAE